MSEDLLCLEENGGCKVGTRAGQALVLSRLVRESGSILEGIRGPGGFLFLFSFVLVF